MNREQRIGLIQSDAKFIDEREDIAAYRRAAGQRSTGRKAVAADRAFQSRESAGAGDYG